LIEKFLFKLAIIVLPLFTAVICINFTVDPANIFAGKKYVSGIAAILSKGDNVDNISNYDERLLQEQLILRLVNAPDIIVLGSSRVMEIGRDFYIGKTVINCGVSHANIRDVIAIVGLLDSLHKMPREILLNVDPGLIGNYYTAEWESLAPDFQFFVNKYTEGVIPRHNYKDALLSNRIRSLCSFPYFQSSMEFLLRGKKKKYEDIGNNEPVVYGRHADGTIAYSKTYRNPDTLRVATNARLTGRTEGVPEVDTLQLILFKKLIQTLRNQNIKVSFCLLPFHPAFYDEVNKNFSNRLIYYENYYRSFAKACSIDISGSFNARSLKIPIGEFYDMYHCSKNAIKHIIINAK
jgi:hypothetical protein